MDEIDDLFGDEGDESTDDDLSSRQGGPKNPLREARKHIRDLEKQVKEYEAEVPQLREFKTKYDTEQRESSIKAVFEELGVPERAVKFYKLENPDGEVTKEAVAQWAVENEFAEATQFTGTEKLDEGFKPTSTPKGQFAGSAMGREEWLKLAGSGPEGAEKARALLYANKVDLDEVRSGMGPDK